MSYELQNFDSLLGTNGFSDTLLKNHFTLYGGYVKQTNALRDALSQLSNDGKRSSVEYAELKRRFAWEFNGMKLHEFYFWNLTKNTQARASDTLLGKLIDEQFGSFDTWVADFKASGAMRGIGWVVLYRDLFTPQRLFNAWVNEHDMGHLVGCQPLLVLDVFEHAYITDYGLKRADYIEAFFNAINWEIVENRYNAISIPTGQ